MQHSINGRNARQDKLFNELKFTPSGEVYNQFNTYVKGKSELYSKCKSIPRLKRELDDLEVVGHTLFHSTGMNCEYLEVRAAIESRINYLVSMERMGWDKA